MITINNKKYETHKTEITWGKFSYYTSDKIRKGLAPFITFNINDEIFIGLELIFSKEDFKATKEKNKINIKDYVSDILYKDKIGWRSIINNNFTCNLIRLDKHHFRLILIIRDEKLISINAIIPILKRRIFS